MSVVQPNQGSVGPGTGEWRLTVVTSSIAERVGEELAVGRRLIIGRDATCDVVLADPNVSRRHASIEPVQGGLRVVDLGSGNGVWVDGYRVDQGALVMGQQVRIGATVFECLAPVPVLEEPPDAPTTLIDRADAGIGADRPAPRPFVVRILEGNEKGSAITVTEGVATVGRAADSRVVLSGRDVSRRHARIEASEDGFLITDAGSSYGLWVGSTEVQSYLLKPGEAFRLGQSVLLECVYFDADGPSPDETVHLTNAAGLLGDDVPGAEPPRVVEAPPVAPEPAASQLAASKPVAPAPVVPEPMAAAVLPAAPRVEAVPKPLAAPAVTDADFSQTVVMPIPAAFRAPQTRRIEDEGEAQALHAHTPLQLDDPDAVFYVVTGAVLIFTVAVDGTRTHFLGILPGQCFLGFDTSVGSVGRTFLAVAKPGTEVRKLTRTRLQSIAQDPQMRATVAGLLEGWVGGLSKALVTDLPVRRSKEVLLESGKTFNITTASRATCAQGILWIELVSGSVIFDDLATPVFPHRKVLFPVAPSSWLQPLSDEFGAWQVTPVSTELVLVDEAAWRGLDAFHRVLREAEFIKHQLATVDEFLRLEDKKVYADAASMAGYDAIGSVLRTEAKTPVEFKATTPAEAVYEACKHVGDVIGIDVKRPPASDVELTFEERMGVIATSNGYRTRVVALRDDWWTQDHGPMVGQLTASKDPVALLPDGPTSYVMAGPQQAMPIRVSPEIAASLADFAYTLYRPFPETLLKVGEVIRFGARGLRSDVRWVVAMAVVVGMAGTVTPWLTGMVFDSAIPEADRQALYGFGLALVGVAISTSLFKLTQGIATVRIQARMSSTIQASVWDRMMNLPVNFFRRFSAGDLADRAGGVDAIQDLVAGAGVAAILGSVSGVFFVFQMFTYDLLLAAAAILLSVVFVVVNYIVNRLQLRWQRTEVQVRGRIAGLVLNLVTGVSKLRLSGAEQHAFRTWAQQFAFQRRVSFSVGQIQNFGAVFASVFPIAASIVLFYVVGYQRGSAVPGQPVLTTGQFIAFNTAFGLFLAAMQALGDASLSLLRVVPIYERLVPILSEKPEVDRSKSYPGKLTGAIELSNVRFRYDSDGPFIVNGISLKITAGEFVAFVGSSGCGKSTLMRLMLGFEMPTSGSIYYDNQDLPSLDIRAVRQQMGVVMQQSRVMPTEIYRNIVGVTSRSLEDAWEAATRAGLAEDIKNMPMGMHTYVSEGGGTLSGGQRQRLMIARAIVNKPKIIFLDEATSALDNRTQAIVTESMNQMSATRIVIAHRLSTIQNADRICYLQGGQVLEMGTYDELMAKDGMFAELARRQMA